ncbi:MAG: type II toxin-antitoxin system HicA family toxin [Clostridiales bacterium]|nr:type II toxin-antitoxin system HicA family toxin [Clostridiales bacterium]
MKSYSSREVISRLRKDGWYLMAIVGSHHHSKHPIKKGKATVKHPQRDIPPKTLRAIEEQSGLLFR